MLSQEENERLTRTAAGTPMGDLVRRYWLPFALSADLPGPDCDPVRVRLLGEDLVAWCNTDGSVGVMQNACPHRGASMFFGRNEENGLRCVYHGWKFDIEGNCTDMPNEPAESNFRHKIHIQAYRTRERNGVVWAYLGPEASPPPLPQLEWNLVPADQRYVTKRVQFNNWFQALEEPAFIFNIHVSGINAEVSEPTGRVYLDPRGEKLSDGLIRARRVDYEEVTRLYG